jgi:hypothetical protein
MRVLHEVRSVVRGRTQHHQDLRERIAGVAFVSIFVDLIGTVLVYLFEHDASGTKIKTFGDSVFWTSCQLLTVSSQLPNPLTTGGRITDVFLEAYSITVVATLAGSFGAFFHGRSQARARGPEPYFPPSP